MTDKRGWWPPRCIHGSHILCCPHDDCPTQIAYLDQHHAALDEDPRGQWEAVLRYAEEKLRHD